MNFSLTSDMTYDKIVAVCEEKEMKIRLKYCFLDKIKDIKENLGPLKIIRNNRHYYLKIDLPAWIVVNLALNPSLSYCFFMLCFQFSFVIGFEWLVYALAKRDFYKEHAKYDLFVVLNYLQDLGVNTDYELLLESEAYETKYRLKLNEKRLPILFESKYIMVPSHGFNGYIKETSILQEHVVGTKKYVLSLGSPKRETQLVPATSNL